MKTLDSWHKKARKTNDKLHWNAFRFFRQEVKWEIRITEKEYVLSELLKYNGNTNSIWKVINHCHPREPPLTTVEDPVVQANRFNHFYMYVSVGEVAKRLYGISFVSRMSQSSKSSQLRTIYKMWLNLSFMLWRNRTLKRLWSISHQIKCPGMIECLLECLKTVYQPPYLSLLI